MALVDLQALPADFPTHRHEANFWEKLGRAVATFGFLEEVLGKATFSFTAMKRRATAVTYAEFEAWLRHQAELERMLTDPLSGLINQLWHAINEHPETTTEGLEELLGKLRAASRIRNVLCHGSWQAPDEAGASKPLFVDRKGEMFDSAVDCEFLDQVQQHAAELACAVVNLVTNMGWQFPGSLGPGSPVVD